MRLSGNTALSSTPASIILSPTDNSKILNFINFNRIGSNTINNTNAFKKIQSSSKSNTQNLFNTSSDFTNKYLKINNLYLNDLTLQNSSAYGIKRQHEYVSNYSSINQTGSYLDNKSVSKLLDYNFNRAGVDTPQNLTNSPIISNSRLVDQSNSSSASNTGKSFGSSKTLSPQTSEPSNTQTVASNLTDPCIGSGVGSVGSAESVLGENVLYRTESLRSPNQQILSNERSVRNMGLLNPNKVNYNISGGVTADFVDNAKTHFPLAHAPTNFLGTKMTGISYDQFTSSGLKPSILTAKEGLAPNFLFTPFWLTA